MARYGRRTPIGQVISLRCSREHNSRALADLRIVTGGIDSMSAFSLNASTDQVG